MAELQYEEGEWCILS